MLCEYKGTGWDQFLKCDEQLSVLRISIEQTSIERTLITANIDRAGAKRLASHKLKLNCANRAASRLCYRRNSSKRYP